MVELRVNGETVHVPEGMRVTELLDRRGLAGQPCAVEVNRAVVPKRAHAEHTLRDGDVVEIVTLVGGG